MKHLSNIFPYLSEAEIKDGVEFAAGQLIKLKKFSNKEEAVAYVETIMTKMGENKYRVKFIRIYDSINEFGIALKTNATSKIYKEMKLQLSILSHFSALNYKNSPLKKAVQNAREVFQNTPYNSSVTITA